MPYVTYKFDASGPIIDLWIGVSAPRRRLLEARKFDVPPAMRLSFLIDTGADTTMVAEQHMRSLQLPARGAREILTATSDLAPTVCPTYDVELALTTVGDPPFIVPALEVLARPLFNHSIDGLLGRDILERLTLTVFGKERRFRLDY